MIPRQNITHPLSIIFVMATNFLSNSNPLYAQSPASLAKEQSGSSASKTASQDHGHRLSDKITFEEAAKLSQMVQPSNDAEDRARVLYEAGDMKGAERECSEAIRLSARGNGKLWNTSALQLMGEIYLQQGRTLQALGSFLGCYHNTHSTELDLDVAIAYCRLKQYRNALRYYSDQMIMEHMSGNPRAIEDVPGTKSLSSLEASALLARGAEDYSHGNIDGALRYFLQAERLAPKNALIANYIGESFFQKQMSEAAITRYRQAAATSRSDIAKNARRRVAGIESWQKRLGREAAQKKAP